MIISDITLLSNAKAQAPSVAIGININPKPVTDDVLEVEVSALKTVSTDVNNVDNALSSFISF